MRSTSILEGLSSIASKLHPQLPLSSKESQRLLTALTTSFRQRLDEAHPQLRGEDERPKTRQRGGGKTGSQNLHSSSAAFADRHMASVLTNPLLAKSEDCTKPELDFATAKAELQKNPAKDPVELLEEYQEKGAATIAIAVLCLEKFEESIAGLSAEKQQEAVIRTGAGRRTLLWLWKSKIHETCASVDDKRLVGIMVDFIVRERLEEYLWDWVKMNMVPGDRSCVSDYDHPATSMRYRYRWEGYLIQGIVAAKLKDSNGKSADAALHAFFQAWALKQEAASARDSKQWIPLGPASVVLTRAFTEPSVQWAEGTNPALYDRFIEWVEFYGRPFYAHFDKASLLLVHPRSPSPVVALDFLRCLLSPQPPATIVHPQIAALFKEPRDSSTRQNSFSFITQTAAQLQDVGRTNDADWVIAETRRLFPTLAQHIEKDLGKYSSREKTSRETSQRINNVIPERLPFPSFT